MVDVVLTLQANGHRGTIDVISRHGTMPQSHAKPLLPVTDPIVQVGDSLRAVVTKFKRVLVNDGHDWRQVVDSVRPITQSLWRGWSVGEQRQFLRHWASQWGVHRHRIAPTVWQQLQQLKAANKLTVQAGRIQQINADAAEGGLRKSYQVSWTPRGQQKPQQCLVDVVINCTGPSANLAKINSPLLQQLVADGYAQWDGLGLQVDQDGRIMRDSQTTMHSLLALGPLTKGSFFEIIAVPDIRHQVANLIIP